MFKMLFSNTPVLILAIALACAVIGGVLVWLWDKIRGGPDARD